MWGLGRSLTDEQITGLAGYYSKQPLTRIPIEGDTSRIPLGKVIFGSGVPTKNVSACHACHGEAGKGNDTFPRMAGQHADYIIKQLNVFQRTNERPEGAVMKTVAHELTEENIKNVAAYLQALPNIYLRRRMSVALRQEHSCHLFETGANAG